MRPSFVLMILGMGVVTFATRIVFIGAARKFELHPMLLRLLEYVPVAVLAALVFPAVLAPTGQVEDPFTNIYVWAAAVTVAVQLIFKKQWISIVVSVAALVALRTAG